MSQVCIGLAPVSGNDYFRRITDSVVRVQLRARVGSSRLASIQLSALIQTNNPETVNLTVNLRP